MAERKAKKTGLSKPAATVYAHMRLSPEEKAKLERLAAECNVSLSYAFREGARLYLEDLKAFQGERKKRAAARHRRGESPA